MFRIVPQISRKTISLNRCLKSSSSCVQRKHEEIYLGEENEPSPPKSAYLTGLSSNLAKRTKQSDKQSDANGIVQAWLAGVRPAELSADELDGVYLQMMRQFKQQEATMPIDAMREFRKSLMKLPDYWRLADRTKASMSQLSNRTLISLLRWFSMIGEDEQNSLFLNTCNELHNRAGQRGQLSLAELAEALFVMHFHIDRPLKDKKLLRIARTMILADNRIDRQEIETITKCIFLFLMPNYDAHHKATKRLIRVLSHEVQLDFRQAVMLLRRVKQSHHLESKEIRKNYYAKNFQQYNADGRRQVFRPKSKVDGHFPSELAELIDKCNTIIHRQLTSRPTDECFDFFLCGLHDFVDAVNHEFADFYSLSLLEPVRDFLLAKDATNGGKLYDLVRYNLVMNYTKMFKFDEALLKRVYETVCDSEELRKEIDVYFFYYMISAYRFPFVDHEHLAASLFGDLDKAKSDLDKVKGDLSKISSRLLAEFILNDVQNEALLNFACDGISNVSSFHVSSNEYKRLALARVYFSMFGRPANVRLKEKIARKLNTIIYDWSSGNKPKLSGKYIEHADSKLQKNGFLSNGMYVKGFGVYDSQEGDFVSLADLRSYFYKIDRMPIKKHQELLLILEGNRLVGHIEQYESNYNHQMKRVLERLSIKSTEVIKGDFDKLPYEKQALYLIQKAKAFYGIDQSPV